MFFFKKKLGLQLCEKGVVDANCKLKWTEFFYTNH